MTLTSAESDDRAQRSGLSDDRAQRSGLSDDRSQRSGLSDDRAPRSGLSCLSSYTLDEDKEPLTRSKEAITTRQGDIFLIFF